MSGPFFNLLVKSSKPRYCSEIANHAEMGESTDDQKFCVDGQFGKKTYLFQRMGSEIWHDGKLSEQIV